VVTEGDRIVRTPTYHAFEMYVPFQDATFLPVEPEDMTDYELGEVSVPHVSATAALTGEGELVVALVNLHARDAVDVDVQLRGYAAASASARVLTGDSIDAHNTFDDPDVVRPVTLDVDLDDDDFNATLPPRSVSVVTLRR
jgi:alpha-N-arabinofuranosidase